jgi:hypothetical protein
MNMSFDLNLRVPSHVTVLNWVKKQGVANFRDKDYFNNEKWILIIDESIQFGNKKLLAIFGVPASKQNLGRALTYKDLVPLVLKSSESWKANDIESEIKSCIDVDQILYALSDNGNNLKSTYSQMGLKHIEDVGHKFSWIMKETFEKQDDFEAYTKHLSEMRGRLSLSKFAHIIPPNQRIVSRFMNLTPLFRWGSKMVKLLDKNQLTEDEREKVAFVNEYRELIYHTDHLLGTLNKIQQLLKNKGFNERTTNQSLKLLENHNDERSLKVKEKIYKYFYETSSKIAKEKTILCSSDIMESCFGKYKSIVKANKSVGITDLCLCISCLMGETDAEQTMQSMAKIKIVKIKDWKEKNIGETLYQKRNTLYKKTG